MGSAGSPLTSNLVGRIVSRDPDSRNAPNATTSTAPAGPAMEARIAMVSWRAAVAEIDANSAGLTDEPRQLVVGQKHGAVELAGPAAISLKKPDIPHG